MIPMKPSNRWRKTSISKNCCYAPMDMWGVKSEHIQNYTKVIMMTEKRFVIKNDGFNEHTVSDRLNQYPMPITDLKSCEFIADALNGLWDKVMRFEKYSQEHLERANKLGEENEQLKQQEKRLYKYFRKCFDNVSEQGFRETWEVVKKYD